MKNRQAPQQSKPAPKPGKQQSSPGHQAPIHTQTYVAPSRVGLGKWYKGKIE